MKKLTLSAFVVLFMLTSLPQISQAKLKVWPFGVKAYRTQSQVENYQYDYYLARSQEIKKRKEAEAQKQATKKAKAKKVAEAVKIDEASVLVPNMRPLLVSVEKHPYSTQSSEKLIRFYMRIRRLDMAMEECERIMQVNPEWPEGRMLKARIHRIQGDTQRERGQYDLLLMDDPDWITPRYHRANYYQRVGNKEKAIQDWEYLLSLAQQKVLNELIAISEQHILELRQGE
jgi:tetratricopeptide (TPR) repeat protein